LFASALQVSDYRTQFSKWWVSEWKNVQFPEKGLVFDYYVDEAQCLMVPWDDKVAKFNYSPEAISSIFVPTVETTRLTYFLDSLMPNRHFVMFVGNTGTGKTAIIMNKLRSMDAETTAYCTLNMNSFCDAPSMQVSGWWDEGELKRHMSLQAGMSGFCMQPLG
jgi:dynein heavy chain